MVHFNPSRNPNAVHMAKAPRGATAHVPFRSALSPTRLAGNTPATSPSLARGQPLASNQPPSSIQDSPDALDPDRRDRSRKCCPLPSSDDLNELDPLRRQLASISPQPVASPIPAVDPAAAQRFERVRVASVDEMFQCLVRRIGWAAGNDRRSGCLCIEIGSGELQGSTLFISTSQHELQIELAAAPGIDVEVWKNRLSRRLASHGLRASLF